MFLQCPSLESQDWTTAAVDGWPTAMFSPQVRHAYPSRVNLPSEDESSEPVWLRKLCDAMSRECLSAAIPSLLFQATGAAAAWKTDPHFLPLERA